MTTDLVYGVEPCDLCVNREISSTEHPCAGCIHSSGSSFFVLDKKQIKKL